MDGTINETRKKGIKQLPARPKNAVIWMLRRVALVRTDVSGERNTSIIRVKRT
jgi:hypothetical protein